MTLFQKLYHLRGYGYTHRYHAERVEGETILHHSANVALLLLLALGERCTRNLLIAALLHDLEEGLTGDVPKLTKLLIGEKALQALEASVRNHFDLQFPELSEQEKELLRIADWMDVYFHLLEQRLLGNRLAGRIFRRIEKIRPFQNLEQAGVEQNAELEPLLRLYYAVRGAMLGLASNPVDIDFAEQQDFWLQHVPHTK